MEAEARRILTQHGCEFIQMLTECRVLWKNQNGVIRADDITVLRYMTREAWDYFKFS